MITAHSLTVPIAFSNSTYSTQYSQPLRVNQEVDSVTATGRCTRAQVGMRTCSADREGAGNDAGGRLRGAQHNQASEGVVESQPACLPLLLPHLLLLSCAPGNQTRHSRPPPPPQLHRTSGVNTVSGTRVQKKPRDTMWVDHLRTPKYSTISSSLRSSGSCTRCRGGEAVCAGWLQQAI